MTVTFSKTQLAGLLVIVLALALNALPANWLPAVPWNPIAPPAPITDKGFKVLVVEETTERGRLTSGQREAILSTLPTGLREYVKSKGGEFRLLDKDSPVDKEAAWVQEAWKVKAPPYPWMLAAKDGRASVGQLPNEIGETMKIAKRFGGE